jgi:hypothetical protein
MTQVISAITQDYVLLVADRRLTFLGGSSPGQIADDDACKLVSLCNVCGIGYTGVARMGGIPTHEWIAKTLASERCSDPGPASKLLAERARIALSGVRSEFRSQTFVIAGWAYFDNLTGLRSFSCAITNIMDASGRVLSKVNDNFAVLTKALHDGEDLSLLVIGQPLSSERGNALERNLRELVARRISAKAALRLLVDEVIHTSGQSHTVGRRVLGLCIPRGAVQASIESGQSVLIAEQPTDTHASFCYFDPTYSELQQFGPTVTCGGSAVTDLKTETDDSQARQSSELKILAVSEKSGAAHRDAIFKRPQTPRSILGFEFGISVDHDVVPGMPHAIPAAIKNTGDVPIVFARDLSDNVGQESPPSVQGGAVPAITFGWPTGDWTITHFEPVSRTQFAGVVIQPGHTFEFTFGSLTPPPAAIGSVSRTGVVDFSIRFTDTIIGQLLNASGAQFNFPTNMNPILVFKTAPQSARSELTFNSARVIDTVNGELISGPVEGSPPVNLSAVFTDTAIAGGKPGMMTRR